MNTPFAEYWQDSCGVVHQLNVQPITYDAAYLRQHTSKPDYQRNSALLNGMRLGLLVGCVGEMESLVDFGYGDGSFARLCRGVVPTVLVYDVGDFEVPEGCRRITSLEAADVYTFWDSLEHVGALEFLRDLPAKFAAVSTPCMPAEGFETWKHRRPHEHLHHFTEESLTATMRHYGWEMVRVSFLEDAVRGGTRNIVSGVFRR